jgi:hypothetical protein
MMRETFTIAAAAFLCIAESRSQALQPVTEFLRFEATQIVHIILPFHR